MPGTQPIKLAERSVLGVLGRRKVAAVGVVARDLGIPASTAVAVLGRLLEKKRVFRREISTGQRGRPSYLYGLRLAKPVAVIHWDGTQLTGAIVDSDSTLLATEIMHAPSVTSVKAAAALAEELVVLLAARAALPRQRIDRLALSVNAIPLEDGRFYSSVLPWVDAGMTAVFARQIRLRTTLIHHPSLLAEYQLLDDLGLDSLAYLHAGDGLSGRFTTFGRVYHGHTEWAGQLGHITRDPSGPVCGCGRRGCLETFCSGPALARALRRRAAVVRAPVWVKEAAKLRSVRALVEQVWTAWSDKDPVARALMEPLLDHLGWGLGLLVNMLDPGAVVAGGYLLQGRSAWIEELRRRCRPWIVYGDRRRIDLRSGQAQMPDLLRTIAVVSETGAP